MVPSVFNRYSQCAAFHGFVMGKNGIQIYMKMAVIVRATVLIIEALDFCS